MTFNIMTLFPEIISAYVKESIIKNAIENKIIEVNIYKFNVVEIEEEVKLILGERWKNVE